MKCRSEWQRPATAVRISTSRGPGFCNDTSSMTRGLLTSIRTAAFIGVSSCCCLRRSLRCREQFANLAHGGRAVAEQMRGYGILNGIFRKPERIARIEAMIDHEARPQQPPGVTAHGVDAMALRGEHDRACGMIEQAGGAPRLGLIVGARGDLPRKADGAVDESAQAVAPGDRYGSAVVEPGMQVGAERAVRAMAAD